MKRKVEPFLASCMRCKRTIRTRTRAVRKLESAMKTTKREGTGCFIATRKRKAEAKAKEKPIRMEKVGEGSETRSARVTLPTKQKAASRALNRAFAWMETLTRDSGSVDIVKRS